MKQCEKCKETKPLAEFSKKKKKKDGLQTWCKKCSKEWLANWHKENPSYHLKKTYNITIEDKQAMMVGQNNSCAICKEPFINPKLIHVDHCHKSTKIRAILCSHCNTALGGCKDSPKILQQAIHYLE